MNKTISAIILGLAIGAAGCSAKTNAQTTKTTPSYTKPGAAIDIASNYDGKTKVGETENIRVIVNDRYDGGALSVNITSSEGLNLSGNTNASASMNGGAHVFDINVSAAAPGRYYVNITATAALGNGDVIPRTSGIAIIVGDPATFAKPKSDLTIEETPSGQRIIIMDAQETISE